MSDFERQYAIRLPDGSLFSVPDTPPSVTLGSLGWSQPTAPKFRVAIWDNEAAAVKVLDEVIRPRAETLGVSDIGAAVVSRVVGPWADPDLNGFLAAVEGLANGELS